MISQLRVSGFQSIQDASLELSGVNLIVGRNFSGKSALLRALHALATNKTGDEFIKQGGKNALVSVVLNDGQEVAWTKATGKGGEYTLCDLKEHDVDARHFDKTAGQVPEEISEALGIRPIQIDDTFALMPQFQRQWDPPFIIGESGSRVARILGKLTKVDVIVTAQMSCRKKRDQHGRTRDTEEETHTRLVAQREELPPVEELREDLDLISTSLARAGDLEDNIAAGHTLSTALDHARAVVAVDLAPVTVRMSEAQVLLSLVRDGREVVALTARLSAAKKVEAIDLEPVAGEIRTATAQVVHITQIRELVRKLSSERSALEGANEGIKNAKDGVTSSRERHGEECTRLGVCDHCPWVEAV